jgi:hypothetical protein
MSQGSGSVVLRTSGATRDVRGRLNRSKTRWRVVLTRRGVCGGEDVDSGVRYGSPVARVDNRT